MKNYLLNNDNRLRQTVDVDLESLELEMTELGATPSQRATLKTNPARARIAIARAAVVGAKAPIAYAMRLFTSESFLPDGDSKPSGVNLRGRVDPTRDDDGERIWQPHEVSPEWRRGYLRECWKALQDGREPVARYAPSDVELAALGVVTVPEEVSPEFLHGLSERALRAWAQVWGLVEEKAA